ncbi:MAG: YcxB family protein [Lachnospiraceae bacterium]|nr:YcxB family protein [Lachnospiraceae bacterium]
MKLEFDVKMTAAALYDYMLRHTYTSPSGLLGTIAGALLVVASLTVEGGTLYFIAGLVILLYLPWSLFIRSRKQILANPAFKEALHYCLDEEGITVSQKDLTETIPWDTMQKAISTGKSIIVYTSPINAFIFPRKEMGDLTIQVIEHISTHMPPKKVNIKY